MQRLSTCVHLRTEPLNTWSQYWELRWEINKSSPRIRDGSALLAVTGAQRGVWRNGALEYAAAALKNHLAPLKGLNTKLPQDPAVPLLGIQPREMKTRVCTKLCPRIFIAALFIITKQQKQPKCSSPDEWINKMCHCHAMSYCSAVEWGLMQAIRGVNLENTLLRKHWLWNRS